MQKVDLKKDLREFYGATAAVTTVTLPPLDFLMIDGRGDPNTSPEYAEAIEALFTVSYAAKFMLKRGPKQIDYSVMPLEGLWWSDDMTDFTTGSRDGWQWTMMIMQPSFVSRDTALAAIAEVKRKKKLRAAAQLRFEAFTEGKCAQVLHTGPFSTEGPTIERVHTYIAARGELRGRHHEIYLSDIRRSDPSAWRTIIRQPFA